MRPNHMTDGKRCHLLDLSVSIGVLELSYDLKALRKIRIFPGRRTGRAHSGKLPAWLDSYVRQIRRYFCGKIINFRAVLVPEELPALYREILALIRKIPYGQTRSYGQVARLWGRPKAARVVGQACRANPIPIIIPCHRVIRADGGLGGYSQGLGIKRNLLALEKSFNARIAN